MSWLAKIWELFSFFAIGYIDFEDRCSRPRYWAIVPVYIAVFTGLTFLTAAMPGPYGALLFWVFILLTFVPFISILVKRLHDFNVTGYAAIALFPLLIFGGIWLVFGAIILLGLVPATRGTNKFGDDARGGNLSVFD